MSTSTENALLIRQAPPLSLKYVLFWAAGMFAAIIAELAIIAVVGAVLWLARQRKPGDPGMGPGELKFVAFFFAVFILAGFLTKAQSMIRASYAAYYWRRLARAPDASLDVLLQACLWDSSMRSCQAFAVRAQTQLEGAEGLDQVSVYLQKIISGVPTSHAV